MGELHQNPRLIQKRVKPQEVVSFHPIRARLSTGCMESVQMAAGSFDNNVASLSDCLPQPELPNLTTAIWIL